MWAYERTLLQSADNRLVRKYLTQLRAYKYNFKKTGKPRKLQTDETFVALVCRSHVISFRCSLMFFCLRARIIRTQKYSQRIRMFRKSVCECNNYNVRTMSSIPSVCIFFARIRTLGLIIASLFDRLDLENVLPQLLHNAHKSGIITGVTPDQQEIQFADYDNQSITTHAVFEDYEVDKNHRHCRTFLLTFSAFKLEVSDLGMNMYIKKGDLRCVSNFQVKTTIMYSLTMHTKQRQKLRAVVQVEIALQNAFPMSCFISEIQPFCPCWVY